MTTRAAPSRPWTESWDPEDEDFWERGGKHIARRNLTVTVLSGHLALSVWGMWSALLLFGSPGTGPAYGPGGAFLLVAAPVAAGAALRWAGSRGRRAPGPVDRPGGRARVVLGTAALLPPALAAAWLVQRPGTPLWTLLIVAATAGAGGGTLPAVGARHLASLYPHRERGLAPGVGGGLSGVVTAQALGLLVIAAAGESGPAYVAVALLPPVALVAAAAALLMDDPVPLRPARVLRVVPPVRPRAVAPRRARWAAALRAGTSGALLGHCLAFGLVLRSEFGCSPRRAAAYALLGALLGRAARSLGGRAPGPRTAGRAVLAGTLGMAVTAALLPTVGGTCGGFAAGFTALCVCGGVGAGALSRTADDVDGRAGSGVRDVAGGGRRNGRGGVMDSDPTAYGHAGTGLRDAIGDGRRNSPGGAMNSNPTAYGRTGTGLHDAIGDGRRNSPGGAMNSNPTAYGRTGTSLHDVTENSRRNGPSGVMNSDPTTYSRAGTGLPGVIRDGRRSRGIAGGGPRVADAFGAVVVLLTFAACYAGPSGGGSAAPALRGLACVHGVCAVLAWAVDRRRGASAGPGREPARAHTDVPRRGTVLPGVTGASP
ncbi:hypothetical protein [Streptomyces eurocidicus]|uniref:Nitrate/nitrite transporter NarK n=1 Tax=Streptomyces eurocidicus TaxID=66423 RepID=A0A7W8F6P5_STREU|nr:hypothetical protein [Streptomyces eurocidicus]MBB5123245.1 nitrate/nitrite transporter NarK [Streptomyces eurocidicus]MBF6056275.1 hypothetical protein [Streptomyces eurocidicus]